MIFFEINNLPKQHLFLIIKKNHLQPNHQQLPYLKAKLLEKE